jgi:hypothetical protein
MTCCGLYLLGCTLGIGYSAGLIRFCCPDAMHIQSMILHAVLVVVDITRSLGLHNEFVQPLFTLDAILPVGTLQHKGSIKPDVADQQKTGYYTFGSMIASYSRLCVT